jgi:hypothetical protein
MNQQEVSEGCSSKSKKWVHSRSASAFFKLSRNSVRRREESKALAVDWIIKVIPPIGGGTGVAIVDDIVCEVSNC